MIKKILSIVVIILLFSCYQDNAVIVAENADSSAAKIKI